MTPEQFDILQKTIQDTVKSTVNGKIDKINDKIDTYIKEDNQWKEDVKPSIDVMKTMQAGSKTILYLLKLIIVLGGAGTAVLATINYFKGN